MGKSAKKSASKTRSTKKAKKKSTPAISATELKKLFRDYEVQVKADPPGKAWAVIPDRYEKGREILDLLKDDQYAMVLHALSHNNAASTRLVEKLIRRDLFTSESRLRQFIELWMSEQVSVYSVSLARVVGSLEKVAERDGLSNQFVTVLHKWVDQIGFVSGATETQLVMRIKSLLKQFADVEIQVERREVPEESLPHREFLLSILDQPEDATRRLIYADWLEEAGDNRCHAIRRWCQRKHLLGLEPHYEDVRSQAWDDGGFERQFDERIKQLGVKSGSHSIYVDDHGGPVSVRCGWSTFVDRAEQLLTAEPGIVCFRPDNWMDDPSTQAVVASGWLEPMLVLDGYRFRRSGIEMILDSETACHNFRELILASSQFTERVLRTLRNADYLESMRTIRASLVPQGDVLAEALAASAMNELHTLIFGSEDLGLKGMRAFAEHEFLNGIRRLELRSHKSFSTQTMQLLSEAVNQSLAALALPNCQIKDAGARKLAKANVSLRELNLSRCGMTADGLRAVLDGLDGRQLERLHLSRNPIGDAGMAAICDASLPNLRQLVVDGCSVTGAGLAPLNGASFAKGLQWLDLSENRLTDVDLAESLALPSLQRLDVARCEIKHKAMGSLGEVCLPALTYLNIGTNPIRDAGAQVIADAAQRGWNLRFLQYDPRYVKDATKKRLDESIHKIKEYKW